MRCAPDGVWLGASVPYGVGRHRVDQGAHHVACRMKRAALCLIACALAAAPLAGGEPGGPAGESGGAGPVGGGGGELAAVCVAGLVQAAAGRHAGGAGAAWRAAQCQRVLPQRDGGAGGGGAGGAGQPGDCAAGSSPRPTWRRRACRRTCCIGPRDGWEGGDPAEGPTDASSFDALDAILARLADKRLFPALRAVVIAGHSGRRPGGAALCDCGQGGRRR